MQVYVLKAALQGLYLQAMGGDSWPEGCVCVCVCVVCVCVPTLRADRGSCRVSQSPCREQSKTRLTRMTGPTPARQDEGQNSH